jgi:ribosomal protein S18 acetylase RimI-like enzyme
LTRVAATAFLSAIDDGCAERILATPGGSAILDSRHPALWSANHLRLEAVDPPAPEVLHAAALTHFAGLGFQMITVRHEALARALAPPLAALGYRPEHERLLVLLGPPPARPAPLPIVEIEPEDLAPSRIGAQLEAGRTAEVGRQLTSRDALIGQVVAQRWFATRVDGEVAARCQLRSLPGVAQIENVYTAPAHRRRGLSRALLAHAAAEALADGADPVFLVTPASGWPQGFYRRAGFTDAGLLARFLRMDRRPSLPNGRSPRPLGDEMRLG